MAYHEGYYKLKSNKLHANIHQLRHKLAIYFSTFLPQSTKYKTIISASPISQHDVNKSLVPIKLHYRSNLEIPRRDFARLADLINK